MKIGAIFSEDGSCEFIVWAPFLEKVELEIVQSSGVRHDPFLLVPMEKDKLGYWRTVVGDAHPGTLYLYRLDCEKERPDPASYSQPSGVHSPSQVIDHSSFNWGDENWKGIALAEMIIYELHVGTFTEEGTFDAVIPGLDELLDLGVNAIELMPVAQFPGGRNWGYDGVYPYAVQNSYGGADGLKRLVDQCHKKGMAVILDVVYNHLGPEGNYLWDYGPYFTRKYKTPWGEAINYDSAYSDNVKNFFVENAIYWLENYHMDALRLDAVHGIFDMSARHFLMELAESVDKFSREKGRVFYLIAESNLNDARVITPRELGGYGIHSQWSDDLHHSLHTLLTGEDAGYYVDFGNPWHLAKSLKEGFVYTGQHSIFRRRKHGNSTENRQGEQFVVFSQNHDQIGNRMLGERLSALISFEGLKLAAGAVLLSPYIPLLFMGEEYGEESPFLYFVSHSDSELIEAVRKGRAMEFEDFNWSGEPPDPQSEATFLRSRIDWIKRNEGKHKNILDFYKALIGLRKKIPALSVLDKDNIEVREDEKEKTIFMKRWNYRNKSDVFVVFNFNKSEARLTVTPNKGTWKKVLDSSHEKWNGPGALTPETIVDQDEITIKSYSLVLYEKENKHGR